jgi:hypothetical protein
MNNRSFLACTALATLSFCGHAVAQNTFSIIALPDTQNYVNNINNAALFTQQTQWISDQILNLGNPRNIKLVTHLGDVVSNGSSLTEFQRADASMSVLDGGLPQAVVPYSVLPGNHDYAATGNKSSGTDLYLQFFGPLRFVNYLWYQGADPSGNNSYQVFTAAGRQWLHIALEYQPTVNVTNGPVRDPSPIQWAQSIISAHPGMPTIVSTHEHIDDDPAGRSGTGQQLWDQLISINDQIIMVLNGHFHSVGGSNDGEYHQVSQNLYGNTVIEALQDFQDYPNGGNGWLRIITFDIDSDAIHFETYTPVLDQFQTETVEEVGGYASDFVIDMDFSERFMFADPPQPPAPIFEIVIFQEGVDGYIGTADKELRSSGSDENNGDNPEISVDGDDGSPGLQPNHGLIKFENIIAAARDAIPQGTEIASAEVALNVTNPGSGMQVYKMTTAWDEFTTWADFGGDGITPGDEAAASPALTLGDDNGSENVPTGTLTLDITDIMRDWLSGETNHGIGLVPFTNGTNGIDFDTSEGDVPPALIVKRLLPGLALRAFRQGADGYTGAVDTQLRENTPASEYSAATSFSVDADDPNGNGEANHILIRFDDLFGTDPDQVPTNKTIVRATLVLDGFNPGDGGSLHRMLQTWSPTDTWGGAFGGDGVQADDVESVAVPDAFAPGSASTVEIIVTASLQAWQADPSTNHGWVILPQGGDGWDFSSNEAAEGNRPRLEVVYELDAPCPQDFDNDDEVGTSDFFALLQNWGACPSEPDPCPWDLTGAGDQPDGDVGTADFFNLLQNWGACQ